MTLARHPVDPSAERDGVGRPLRRRFGRGSGGEGGCSGRETPRARITTTAQLATETRHVSCSSFSLPFHGEVLMPTRRGLFAGVALALLTGGLIGLIPLIRSAAGQTANTQPPRRDAVA